ncbi:MAG: IucA/IucC family protein, partial [Frankia sp.]|nr:IucA/IucC family protein [Frankia sp.]
MTFAGFPPAASAPATWAAILATETLLRCWFRETGTPVPAADGVARLALADGDAVVAVPVRYRSPAGWHRFGQPYLVGGEPLDFAALAALLARDAARRVGQPDSGPALARLLGSARRIAAHLAAPRPAAATADPPAAGPPATGPLTAEALVADLAPPAGPDGTAASAPFLAGEQALVTGHPFHPAACDRSGAADDELAAYSPELGGTFQVHWFAAEPSVVRGTAIGGQGAAAATRRSWVSRTLRALAADARLPDGYLPIPAHPWQARAVLADPAAAELLADGRLVHLGPAGAPWFPTASLRTVWQPRSPVMLKLSLGLRITNSRRVNQPGELELAAQFAALFDPARPDGPGRWLAARPPAVPPVAAPAGGGG